MPLILLKVAQFRNLTSVELQPDNSLNFLCGANGSGKTSLLEAVSLLAHGRSFRTRKFRRLIQNEQDALTVFGRLSGSSGTVEVGVHRTRQGDSEFRIDGVGVTSSAELAARLPLLVLNGDSFGLLTGPPKHRRQFFDWLVFHVKHDFRSTWKQFTRCVKQRNSLLRRDKIEYADLRPWDLEIARLSRLIEADRADCISPFLEHFEQLLPELDLSVGDLAVDYDSGWKTKADYEQQLFETYTRDRRLGYTTQGPHKSDIKITIGGLPAADILSRGQQKSLIAGLYIAEARTFSARTERDCVFLIDDMPAELDAISIARVGRWLNHTTAQTFVTSVEFEPIKNVWPGLEERPFKVFHVKQGAVDEADDVTPA